MPIKYSERMSLNSLEQGNNDPKGTIFFNSNGLTDLTHVNIVGNFVDTVRQLYLGKPDLEVIEHLDLLCKSRQNITNKTLQGEWHVAHMGKAARYRYKIQNNDLGIVCLFGSYFTKLENEGQHLKLELSPKYIASHSPESIQEQMDLIARYFMSEYKPKGCAIHLATDVQGWEPRRDFIEKFTTYSKTIKIHDGMSELDLSDLNMSAATYGGKGAIRNYTIGRPSALQICIYDKTEEIKISDKVDFYQNEWEVFSMGLYDSEKAVKRIEVRLHHQIIREVGLGMDQELESFLQVSEHLTDIWRYALTRNRLDCNSTTIDPFWQLIQEDSQFHLPANGLHIIRKKKHDVTAIGRNFTAILGNIISVMARNKDNSQFDVFKQLKSLDFYDDIERYYRSRGISEADLKEIIRQGLLNRRLIGKAA